MQFPLFKDLMVMNAEIQERMRGKRLECENFYPERQNTGKNYRKKEAVVILLSGKVREG